MAVYVKYPDAYSLPTNRSKNLRRSNPGSCFKYRFGNGCRPGSIGLSRGFFCGAEVMCSQSTGQRHGFPVITVADELQVLEKFAGWSVIENTIRDSSQLFPVVPFTDCILYFP